jgi:hypothetical protein
MCGVLVDARLNLYSVCFITLAFRERGTELRSQLTMYMRDYRIYLQSTGEQYLLYQQYILQIYSWLYVLRIKLHIIC